uniref:Uncharacterized protein n=1 Tax=Globodera rostochiensis TaxID=31243 RepID=A0A914IHJ4_GLORO
MESRLVARTAQSGDVLFVPTRSGARRRGRRQIRRRGVSPLKGRGDESKDQRGKNGGGGEANRRNLECQFERKEAPT